MHCNCVESTSRVLDFRFGRGRLGSQVLARKGSGPRKVLLELEYFAIPQGCTGKLRFKFGAEILGGFET